MLVIGIAGGTGSGKTTVVDEIMRIIGKENITILTQDNYYKDNSSISFEDREKLNYDHPNSIDFDLLIYQIKELKKGNTIHQPIYSFAKHNREQETTLIKPKKIILVEGILIFSNLELLNELDIKVFISTDDDERLIRRIRRDIKERNRTLEEVLSRYQTTLKPMHEQFIEPSKKYADIIIPNMKRNPASIEILTNFIQNRLNTQNESR
ncbi:MAG: uridine kinase [Flavobacteriales bacterium]|nr:uridine kinase [Flavobacteriales bacterium]